MAHGLPDYYRGVDIAYQALSQMIVRPKYGGAEYARGSVVVGATGITQLCVINGKGMIYGGMVFLDHTASQKNGLPILYIGTQPISLSSFYDANKYNLDKPNTSPFYLLKYDETNFIYAAGLSSCYTFESKFMVYYGNDDGGTPRVYYDVAYALI